MRKQFSPLILMKLESAPGVFVIETDDAITINLDSPGGEIEGDQDWLRRLRRALFLRRPRRWARRYKRPSLRQDVDRRHVSIRQSWTERNRRFFR